MSNIKVNLKDALCEYLQDDANEYSVFPAKVDKVRIFCLKSSVNQGKSSLKTAY